MRRLGCFLCAAFFGAAALNGLGSRAGATPPTDALPAWTHHAIDDLDDDGVIDELPEEVELGDEALTREQMADLVAGAIGRLKRNGVKGVPKRDLDWLQRLIVELRPDLVLRGVRVTSIDELSRPPALSGFVKSFQVQGTVALDGSLTQQSVVPHTIAGGPIDPFVNAFLSSPIDDDPFVHAPGPGSLFRVDNRIVPTYDFTRDVSLSVPFRTIEYHDAFGSQDQYLVQPALVLNIAKYGSLTSLYIVGGQLDDLASSRLGLTYRAPDSSEQGNGFQNPVQPYEQGFEIGGTFHRNTQFQASWSALDQSMIDTIPGMGDEVADNNYFQIVNPRLNSLVQPGGPVAASGRSRTDSFVASAGPLPAVSLSNKAALGSVFISAVDGTVCTAAGMTPGGTACPIGGRAWYYVDQTNQVVFRSPLPVGTSVQITYSTRLGDMDGFPRETVQFQREHFNARVSQRFPGLPDAGLGFSFSRIVDSGNFSADGTFGTGYGAVSDTVMGVDAGVPLPFIKLPGGHLSPVVFGEGAYSKYTPDYHNTPAVSDSALAVGLRLRAFGASAIVQYQEVGPNFLDGAPIRYLGPGPSTFQFWRGNYFPGFYGFANNLAINRTFDDMVQPGCAGAACTSRNENLTYIYPVFNPFVATGPQYYSAFAPNTRGLTATLAVPLRLNDFMLRSRFRIEHLDELDPNGFGQIAYGPGFASGVRLKFDRVEGDLDFHVPIASRELAFNVNGSDELLARDDHTAYAYVPFNPMTGGPDAASGAILNAFLAGGATPVLFYPNYVAERHTTIGANVLLPLSRDLRFGLGYNAQNYFGAYGTTVEENIAEHRDVFGASLTYEIPRTMSLLGLLFSDDRYTDYELPSYNYSLTREDLNFTKRF